MKNFLEKFANSLLSKEQMKGVKGGNGYCQCEGGNPVGNPYGMDCMYVCFGVNPGSNGAYYGNIYGAGASNSPNPPNGGWTPCTTTHSLIDANGNLIATWSGC